MKDKSLYSIILILFSLLLFVFALLSFFLTGIEKQLFFMSFCLRSECIGFFSSHFRGLLELFKGVSFLFALITAVVACKAYSLNSKVFRFDTHTSNFRIFNDVLAHEVKRNSILSYGKINSFFWYKLIYPKSLTGDLSLGRAYEDVITELVVLIDRRNCRVQGGSREAFNYKEHQTEFIAIMKKMGIDCERSPNNDFTLVQKNLIQLINSINSFFTLKFQEIPDLKGI